MQDGDAAGVAASDSEDEGGAVARRGLGTKGPKDGGASKGKRAAGNKVRTVSEFWTTGEVDGS